MHEETLWNCCSSRLAPKPGTNACRYFSAGAIRFNRPHLGLEGKALRQAVIDIMMINASVHTAVVSDMDPDEFHEATEGLGILMPLPTSPKAGDAERLLKALAGVM